MLHATCLTKFQVPQFIETETKLIGPFTLKQFLWLAIGGALVFIMFLTLNRYIFFAIAIPVGGFSTALAFVRVNETPLVNYVFYALNYFMNPKQYVFRKEEQSDIKEIGVEKEIIIK